MMAAKWMQNAIEAAAQGGPRAITALVDAMDDRSLILALRGMEALSESTDLIKLNIAVMMLSRGVI